MSQFISTILFFILTRLFPYLKSRVPLGYDPGLYLYLFNKYSPLPFSALTSLPDWLIKMQLPFIPVLGKIITQFIAPEKFLVPLIIFSSILLFFSIYIVAQRLWGKKMALWTIFIFSCSALQFRFYWYYYLKNLTALSFLVLSFYFLLSNSYLALPFAILTAYTHRPTAALLLITLLVNLIIQKKQRKYFGSILILTLAAAVPYYLATFNLTVLPLLQPIVKSFLPASRGGLMGKASGTFYTPFKALVLSLPYLPLALYGFKKEGLKKKNLLISIPFLVSLLVVLFRLFFFQRVIIFLDFFLIFFAGRGASLLFTPSGETKLTLKTFRLVYFGFLLVFISLFIHQTGQPLIYPDEFREIKMLTQTEPDAYILVTDREYTPWIYGWSDRRPIAPGFGEYDLYWTIPEWHQFWESGDRKIEHDLLLKLPQPLYLYHGDHGAKISTDFSDECFKKINWRTYKFICGK